MQLPLDCRCRQERECLLLDVLIVIAIFVPFQSAGGRTTHHNYSVVLKTNPVSYISIRPQRRNGKASHKILSATIGGNALSGGITF